jgi:hypothetical protein
MGLSKQKSESTFLPQLFILNNFVEDTFSPFSTLWGELEHPRLKVSLKPMQK